MENIDQKRMKKLATPLGIFHPNNVAGQRVFREANPNDLLEFFDSRRTSGFIVVTIEAETHAKVPAQPHAT